jgi:hypothetical protein
MRRIEEISGRSTFGDVKAVFICSLLDAAVTI